MQQFFDSDALGDYELAGEKVGNQKQYLMLKRLIEAVFNDIGIETISRILEDILTHPLVIVDMGLCVAAHSPSLDRTVQYAGVCTPDGFLGDLYQELIRNHYLYPQLREREFVNTVIPCAQCGGLLMASIKISEADAMLLVVFLEGQKPDKEYFLLIKKICQVLAVEFQKENKPLRSRFTLPNHKLDALLSGRRVDREEFLQKADRLKWLHAKEFYLLCIASDDLTPLDKRIGSFIHQLKVFIPLDHCLLREGFLVCFLSPRLHLRIAQHDRTAFVAFLERNRLQATLSNVFRDLWDSPHAFALTKKVQRVAHRFRTRLLECEHAQFHILANLLEENDYDIADFCHPAISFLVEFDRKNNTQLLRTLQVYLEGKTQIDSVAESLYIHRSTLFYRLKKIKELTGLTLEGIPELTGLYFSIQVLKLCRSELFKPQEE